MQHMETQKSTAHNAKIDAFVQHDNARTAFMLELVQQNQALQCELENLKADYDSEQQSRRSWQNKVNVTASALRDLRSNLKSQETVLIILDGDGAIFKPELYSQGREGGAQAAHRLHKFIQSTLVARFKDEEIGSWQIITHLVLSARGLARKLKACDPNVSDDHFSEFSHGWVSQPYTFWTDVGHGKERADHKLRELLQMYMPASACKHVFFGPCSDNGYLTVLEGYKLDGALSSKISLIETRPAEYGFTQLGFPLLQLPTVFRGNNLTESPVALTHNGHERAAALGELRGVAVADPPEPDKPSLADAPAVSSWAMVSRPTNGANATSLLSQKQQPRFILMNKDNQRLDADLEKPSLNAEQRFNERTRDQHICNEHHLLGRCDLGVKCGHQHVKKLPEDELLVLKHKARGLPCYSGSFCRDFLCISGHQCRFKNDCKSKKCRFDSFHGIDLRCYYKLVEGCVTPTKIVRA